MTGFWRDVRLGVRSLLKSPGFTTVALITLALGIGANTAIFSAVDRILLHPLPYPQSDRLVVISSTSVETGPPQGPAAKAPVRTVTGPGEEPKQAPSPKEKGLVPVPGMLVRRGGPAPAPEMKGPRRAPFVRRGGRPGTLPSRGTGGPGRVRKMTVREGGGPGGKLARQVFSYPDFEDLRTQSHAFEQVAAYHETLVTLTQRGEPVAIRAVVASPSLFPLLRVRTLIGRPFTAADDREGAPPVALIGEGLWRQRFSGDPSVLGNTIELNHRAYTVVGVLPATLRFPPMVAQAEVWIPLVADPVSQVQQMRTSRGLFYLSVIGRLRPGVTIDRANAELSTLADRLAKTFPGDAGRGIQAAPLSRQIVKHYRLALLVLLAAVGLVLLIACANVANLLLARATVRERELALRLALGAGRGGVVRQLLVESLELSLAGGAAGVLVAHIAVAGFVSHLPPMLQEFQGVTVSGSVLAFAAVISMGAGILMGLLPAWRLSDLRIHEALKGSGSSGKSVLARGRLREALVLLEVALAVIVLAGAGLLLRSFGKLVSVPLGFEPQGVLMAPVNLSAAGYKNPDDWRAFVSSELHRLRAQPGVVQAAAAGSPPMGGMRMIVPLMIPGRPLPPDEMPVTNYRIATPDYFKLMRIPLLRGRTFLDSDTAASARVCIVNQAFVQRYFPSVDPLTRQIRTGMPPAPCQIVGVVGNVVTGSLSTAPEPAVYAPLAQAPFFAPNFLVRSAGSPAALAPVLREQLHALNAALPVAPETLTSLLSRSVEQDRLRTELVSAFAALAILLAAVGISGVLGYAVSRRTQEIGVRMALGATPGEVLLQVVSEGLRLVAVGAVVGLGAAFGLTRLMRTLLFGVSSSDAATYAGVALVLLVVALGACAFPALRASRVDPTVALRYE